MVVFPDTSVLLPHKMLHRHEIYDRPTAGNSHQTAQVVWFFLTLYWSQSVSCSVGGDSL